MTVQDFDTLKADHAVFYGTVPSEDGAKIHLPDCKDWEATKAAIALAIENMEVTKTEFKILHLKFNDKKDKPEGKELHKKVKKLFDTAKPKFDWEKRIHAHLRSLHTELGAGADVKKGSS